MIPFQQGDVVESDGLLAVGTDEDPGVSQDRTRARHSWPAADDRRGVGRGDRGALGGRDVRHLALWYGDPRCARISEGGTGGLRPEVWIVPAEYCTPAAAPDVRR